MGTLENHQMHLVEELGRREGSGLLGFGSMRCLTGSWCPQERQGISDLTGDTSVLLLVTSGLQ